MGRKKSYDRSEAAERALETFWEKGFQGTSLRDLEEATGVNRYGLYDSFTDKEGLFRECMESYCDGAAEVLAALPEQGMDGLLALVRRFAEPQEGDKGGEYGCLVVTALLERENFSAEVRQRLDQHVAELVAQVRAVVTAEQQAGRLRADLDVAECAEFVHLLLVGLPTMSRLSENRSGMHLAARAALRVLESWRC